MTINNTWAASCKYNEWKIKGNQRAAEKYLSNKSCNKGINYYWKKFGFPKKYWDEGFGFHDACNWKKPLSRMFNALFVLQYAYYPRAKNWDDLSGPSVKWAYPYVARGLNRLDDTLAGCYKSSSKKNVIATTQRHWYQDEWIKFWLPFFYTRNMVERAATIFHEVRHWRGNLSHNCGKSKDKHYPSKQPYALQVDYLITYYWHANRYTSKVHKAFAKELGKSYLGSKFCKSVAKWAENVF